MRYRARVTSRCASQNGTIGLTRNGTLQLNDKRQLTTQTGMLVQPPITIPAGVDPSQVSIASNGTVRSASRRSASSRSSMCPAPNGLVADGDSVFSATAASGAIGPPREPTLQQGALEGSNVNMGDEMSNMMAAQQQYAMGSQAIQYQAQMLQIATRSSHEHPVRIRPQLVRPVALLGHGQPAPDQRGERAGRHPNGNTPPSTPTRRLSASRTSSCSSSRKTRVHRDQPV